MDRPGQHLWICALQLHRVRTELLPHPREGASSMASYPSSCGPGRSTKYLSYGLKLSNSTLTKPPLVVGCARCFSTVSLYTATRLLQLPRSSIAEEFKVGKARLHMMLQDSPYDVIRQVQPEVRTGTKWSAAKAVLEAEASLQIKEVIGATQTGRAGLKSLVFPRGKQGPYTHSQKQGTNAPPPPQT